MIVQATMRSEPERVEVIKDVGFVVTMSETTHLYQGKTAAGNPIDYIRTFPHQNYLIEISE